MRCNDSRTRKQVNLRSHPLLLWFTWSFLRLKTTVSKEGAVLYGSRIFLFGWEWLLYCYHVCSELFLRLRLNRVKTNFRNQFPENPCVWLSRKTLFSGKWFPVDHKFHLWPGNEFLPSFSLQFTSGKKRERERERARARGEDPVRDRELQLQSDGEIAIAPSIAIWRHRDRAPSIAISDRDRAVDRDPRSRSLRDRDRDPDRDRAVDRDEGSRSRRERRDRDLESRSRPGRRTENISGINDFFFLGCGLWLVFSDLCFPSSFPNTRKYFPDNFLKCNQTHGKIFLFRKLAFPENMYFPENVLQQPNTA